MKEGLAFSAIICGLLIVGIAWFQRITNEDHDTLPIENVDFDLINRCFEWSDLASRGTNMTFLFAKCKESIVVDKRKFLGATEWSGTFPAFVVTCDRPCLLLQLPDDMVAKNNLIVRNGHDFKWNIFHYMAYRRQSRCANALVERFPALVAQQDDYGDTPFSLADRYLRGDPTLSQSDARQLARLKEVFRAKIAAS